MNIGHALKIPILPEKVYNLPYQPTQANTVQIHIISNQYQTQSPKKNLFVINLC